MMARTAVATDYRLDMALRWAAVHMQDTAHGGRAGPLLISLSPVRPGW
jgi:hypothetical protein